ncbi:PTS 2-O-a-mannosyl-D-glycerate transporter subunit IIABC [Alteribacillus sp. JSM 102045]|uniref:PTS 2-O-a-mannosyl-D-glycerate transporter subunit IIABC n=1 Tax=Alteribacillus sp. JSM 102045 TaxID=1562101 RepID=UPI0035C079C2
MKLSNITNENLILINESFQTKQEALEKMTSLLKREGKIESEDVFLKALIDREAQSATGFENGLAIPHGKSDTVKEAAFVAATLEKPIEDWESIDPENKVDLIFLLAIPSAESDSTHLEVLAALSTRLTHDAYRQNLLAAKTPTVFMERLDKEKEEEAPVPISKDAPLIVGITACPAGIAHTYMSAEALENAGKELGYRVRVEKQGANGVEDPLTPAEIQEAEAVIVAKDVQVKRTDRLKGKRVVETSVAAPLKQAKGLIQRALEAPAYKGDSSSNEDEQEPENQSTWEEVKQAVLTGISYIVPVIIAGGMLLAFALFIAQTFDMQELYDTEGTFLNLMRELGGGMLGTLMVPILGAYIAYSIADKPGLTPGFAAGLASTLIDTGFVGGLVGGLMAGYLMKWMKANIRTSGVFSGFVSFWVYPVVSTIIIGVLMFLVIGKPLIWFNDSLVGGLESLSGANLLLLGAVIGMMVSFDLGGPVNKAAYAFCIGLMAEGNFLPYAAFASVKMVSAFTVTAATVLFKKYFDEYEQEVGKSTWILGLAGITEGAIPLMLKDPIRVIGSFLIGSAVTGAIVMSYQIGLPVPGAGIFSLFFLEGAGFFEGALIWLGAPILGTIISTALLIALKIQRYKKLQQS